MTKTNPDNFDSKRRSVSNPGAESASQTRHAWRAEFSAWRAANGIATRVAARRGVSRGLETLANRAVTVRRRGVAWRRGRFGRTALSGRGGVGFSVGRAAAGKGRRRSSTTPCYCAACPCRPAALASAATRRGAEARAGLRAAAGPCFSAPAPPRPRLNLVILVTDNFKTRDCTRQSGDPPHN